MNCATPEWVTAIATDGRRKMTSEFAVDVKCESTRPIADLRIAATVIDPPPLNRDGQGRVAGTVIVTNLGPTESGPVRLLISANRADSARAAKVMYLSCAPSQSGTTCTDLSRLNRGIELAFHWEAPVSGAGQLIVTFELQDDTTTDPQLANNKASVEVELRQPPP